MSETPMSAREYFLQMTDPTNWHEGAAMPRHYADDQPAYHWKNFLRPPLPSHGVGMNLPNRVGRATSNTNQRVTPSDAMEKGIFLCRTPQPHRRPL